MEAYETLSEAMTALRQQGYTEDFNLRPNWLECNNGRYKIAADEFNIEKSFRFDVDEDPSDQAVLYAIHSQKHDVRGLLVNGYGLYSDDIANELLSKFTLG